MGEENYFALLTMRGEKDDEGEMMGEENYFMFHVGLYYHFNFDLHNAA